MGSMTLGDQRPCSGLSPNTGHQLPTTQAAQRHSEIAEVKLTHHIASLRAIDA